MGLAVTAGWLQKVERCSCLCPYKAYKGGRDVALFIFNLFNLVTRWSEWSNLFPGKEPQYLWNRWLGGPQR